MPLDTLQRSRASSTHARGRVQLYREDSKAWRGRFMLLCCYGEVLKVVPPHASDTEALRRIAKSKHRTMAERVHAYILRSRALWSQGKVEDAIREQRKGLAAEAAATAEERAALVPRLSEDIKLEWLPASEFLEGEIEEAKAISAENEASWNCTERPKPSDLTRRLPWPVGASSAAEQAAQLAAQANAQKVRSAACAQCGAAGVKLSRCARCKIACYCSDACQRAGWKVHKPQCRAPGEHREGDLVMLHSMQEQPQFNGQWFCVVGPDPRQQGRWLVFNKGLNNRERLSVPASSMQHVLTH